MIFKILYFTRSSWVKRNKYINKGFTRYASSGLNMFSIEQKHVTNQMKRDIEVYWRDQINLQKCNGGERREDTFYVLSMFPYPSGSLHMGHVRVYTISDTIARFYRMKGKTVIHPMGWDAFGLPAENAAIEHGVDPAEWTKTNIRNMRDQLKLLNYSFDWDKELCTSDPEYYRWTQDLFLKLFEKRLVYQKEAVVNWDPVDETVLAEEQVDSNNRSWRSGAKVQKKLQVQWFIKTTAFAKSLLDGLTDPILKEWKDVAKLQEHWIGDCNGISFEFKIVSDIPEFAKGINLWTAVPAFVEYAKYVVISPDNILNIPEYTRDIALNIKELNAKVINPFNNEQLPMYVSDQVAFPDGRDSYLGIPSASMEDMKFSEMVGIPFERHSICTHKDQQDKLSDVISKAREWNIGGYPVSSKLKDWLISRQRYWGTPIPVIQCKKCGVQPVPRNNLPVILPRVNRSSRKGFTLHDVKDWARTNCPKCGNEAYREIDTMDTFVDSSWYFLRYIDPKNTEEMFSTEKGQRTLPVDIYIGGKEHAVLHLYYARFINHFLHSEGLLPTREPFKQLLVQGMVKGKTYQVEQTGQYVKQDQVEQYEGRHRLKSTGDSVRMTWEKMSKSKYNGIDPLDLLDAFGIDMTRLLILADVAPTSHRNWSVDTVPGIRNWQNRMWQVISRFLKNRKNITLEELQEIPVDPKFIADDEYMFDCRNYFLKTVTFNITSSQQLSVAISRLQGLTNGLTKASEQCVTKSREFERALAAQIIMLAPLAPHFASELWSGFCSIQNHLIHKTEVSLDKGVVDQKWPEIDMNYKMALNIHINREKVCTLKIPRCELDELTVDTAFKLAESINLYQKRMKSHSIEDIKFYSEKGYDSNLYVMTDSSKRPIVSETY